ncbi:tyrosyl-DNA phosphodiesterase-like protein [Elsinoe australis]|uniref:Tyrosyl-DNA phosphodiesterase-like protein n=1 Tax=Elsinoe australis TaxID=40998 RepID=A0A4U7AS97_9PEZI|nr:tyrosyl-DNA phosphodiesterase-like protein [Elsinoe australis]
MLGLAGLDRKAMEEERLARLRAGSKRSGDDISPPPDRATKIARLDHSKPHSALPAKLSYPDGKLCKTWAYGQERDGRDIKFEEVLERPTLKTAVFSAYTYDFDWFFRKIDPQNTTYHFVVSSDEQHADLESLHAPNVKAYKPKFGRLMHSKLIVLVHPTKLRVVIPSANLVDYDWGETGIMENTVWLIDLPRRPPETDMVSTSFLDELKYFLEKQGLPQTVLAGLDKFDWSATRPYAFVHSVGGISYGTSAARTGLTGLSAAVRRLGLASTQTQVDMCASSVGALTEAKLNNLHAATRGDYSIPLSPSGRSTVFPQPANVDVRSSFRLYFPTHEYVANSPNGGVNNGGTIWFNRTHFEKSTFPRSIFREFKSTRGHLLSHCKMLFVRGIIDPASTPASGPTKLFRKKSDNSGAQQVAYVYAGSANCSDAAWGTLVAEKRAGPNKGQLHMTCNNWECGVLIPVIGPNVNNGNAEESNSAGRRLGGSKLDETNIITIEDEIDGDGTASEDETESEDESDGKAKTKNTKVQNASPNTAKAKQGGKRIDPQLKDKHCVQFKVELPGWDVFKSVVDGPFQYPATEYGPTQQPWYVRER